MRSDSPGSPSSTGIAVVVRRHIEEAATRWWRRDSAYVDNPRTRFQVLVGYDETIDAHLDGMQVAGQFGMDLIDRALAVQAPDLSADIFAALALAYLSDDDVIVARMFAKVEHLPGAAWSLEGVFAWLDTRRVSAAVEAQLAASDSRYRDAALAQCHTHRLSGGVHLAKILDGSSLDLVARALRTAGECGRVDLLPSVLDWLEPGRESSSAIRFWAAWAATLLGGFNDAVAGELQTIVEQGGSNQRAALRQLCLSLPRPQLLAYLQKLSPSAMSPNLLIEAIGWSGDASFAPWLLEQMRIPPRAAMAAEAFRLITGFDCDQDQGDASLAPPDDIPVPRAGEAEYPYPDIAKVSAWWHTYAAHFSGHSRLFLGMPLGVDLLTKVFRRGEQAHRELAAFHWVLLRPGSTLLPSRAHSAIQWRRLLQLKESSS
ncbi:hypothetical protein HF313_23110 [Massilia atriviolacea]|uniref:TIGR02270 family protein n=1 Tax=Massilia atriviolacea TaxID=2495579 RepID=A0A430HKK7_9BURK|nr:hypothetical protein [Massilia atriviolacea]RSZ58066.1 hypothetical protein EJB06_17385 [Massilia atriviolacea]